MLVVENRSPPCELIELSALVFGISQIAARTGSSMTSSVICAFVRLVIIQNCIATLVLCQPFIPVKLKIEYIIYAI